MSDAKKVVILAHQTAATPELMGAVRERARRGPAQFHLVVPRRARGMHKVVDPQDTGEAEAKQVLLEALPALSKAAGSQVTGVVGDAEPLMALQDAVNLGDFDEIIISTLPLGMSRWLRMDIVSKARGMGLPVTHVEARRAATESIPVDVTA